MSMSVPGQKSAADLASKNAPWKKTTKWWVMLIQGVVLFALGAYVLGAASNAANAFIYLIALYLLVNGILRVAGRSEGEGRAHQLALLHGIVAIVVSAVVLIIMLTSDTTELGSLQTPGTILGLGILVIAVLSILSAFLFRAGAPIDRGALVSGAVLLIFGIIIFLMLNGTIPFSLIGWISLILGIVLVVTAYGRYQGLKAAQAAAAEEAKQAAALDKAATAAVASATAAAPPAADAPAPAPAPAAPEPSAPAPEAATPAADAPATPSASADVATE
jgi:uncharacterized membrane protein HdeD (DUF308 family)